MVAPPGSIRAFDGLAELAGVAPRASTRQPVSEVAAAPGPRHRDPDRVELSSEACEQCDDEQSKEVEQLRKQDRAVRAHEQAHKAAAGAHAGPISYSYTTGPDGRRYAVAGEVPIDVTPVEGDPEATIVKMQQVRTAALAPAEPSDADRQVAAKAQQVEREARSQMQGQTQGQTQGQLDVYA